VDSSSTGSARILAEVQRFFEEDDWKPRQLEGQPILTMGFKGDNGSWRCYARVHEEQDRFMFYSLMESHVPDDKRVAVAEYLTRANYGLYIGNFEMDFSDGEVRFKTSIDVEGGELTQVMIKNLVYVNVMMMDKYLPGVMSVIYAATPPQDAIEEIEGE
jgi:hypothetical protein